MTFVEKRNQPWLPRMTPSVKIPDPTVTIMTLVEPLGKSAFEFFDKDRDVIHTSAIAGVEG
jgi:hypothetical protein